VGNPVGAVVLLNGDSVMVVRVFDEGLGEPALLILRGAIVGSASCVDKDSKCSVNSFSILDASSGFGG